MFNRNRDKSMDIRKKSKPMDLPVLECDAVGLI